MVSINKDVNQSFPNTQQILDILYPWIALDDMLSLHPVTVIWDLLIDFNRFGAGLESTSAEPVVSKEKLEIFEEEGEVEEGRVLDKWQKSTCYKSLNFGNNYWHLGFLFLNNAAIKFWKREDCFID